MARGGGGGGDDDGRRDVASLGSAGDGGGSVAGPAALHVFKCQVLLLNVCFPSWLSFGGQLAIALPVMCSSCAHLSVLTMVSWKTTVPRAKLILLEE